MHIARCWWSPSTQGEARQERVDQLMEPYATASPPDCWEDEHDEECCNGTLTVWTTLNPYPTWDWYLRRPGLASRRRLDRR